MEAQPQPPPAKVPKLSEGDEEQEECGRVIEMLEERLGKHDENRRTIQDELHEICERLRAQVNELEDRVNKELEERFTPEDNRLQAALNELRESRSPNALQKAKAELLVEQLYEVIENSSDSKLCLSTLYELKTERRIVPELVEMRKPTNISVVGVNKGTVSAKLTFFNSDEERALSGVIASPVRYRCSLFKKDNEQERKEYILDENESDFSSFTLTPDIPEAKTTYGIRVKAVVGNRGSEWSDEVAEFTPGFSECVVWKECPGDVDKKKKYIVDENNPRVATKINDNGRCIIIGSTAISFNTATSWSIKIRKSMNNNGHDIFIGIAPFDINQNDDNNYKQCGWYFDCYFSTLHSGPPHKYRGKEYGPRIEIEEIGQYVHTGDSVGAVMDTTKGDLSFILDGVNRGVAFEGIPLDKPLVPCILLYWQGDSVEIDTSEVKENVDSSIPVLSNIKTKSITWESITLTWNKVKRTSFYQIEVDGNISCDAPTTNTFTKRGLLPETEHSFRVRTVKGCSVGEWSGVVKGRTLKAPEFPECVWKERPDDIDGWSKYRVNEKNPRVATRVNDNGYCTIIGNTHIPLNKVTSWSIKIRKSRDNNGFGIYIGIAPPDINQNASNYEEYGWYFDCHSSKLMSGPPHNYRNKEYGPRKEEGQYVHTRDSVGVVVDTTRGELSFVLNGVNLGVAYEGIPLDKPLVPCVLLWCQRDSVELII